MHKLSLIVVLAFPFAAAPAQGTGLGVSDVGLTLQVGPATGTASNLLGQRCGPFLCAPFASTSTTPVLSPLRSVRVYGAPNSFYALAMSVGPPFPICIPITGIGNRLILDQPVAAISIGLTGALLPSPALACQQGAATYQLNLPSVAPAVIEYHLQALTFSFATQGPAFTVAIRDLAR